MRIYKAPFLALKCFSPAEKGCGRVLSGSVSLKKTFLSHCRILRCFKSAYFLSETSLPKAKPHSNHNHAFKYIARASACDCDCAWWICCNSLNTENVPKTTERCEIENAAVIFFCSFNERLTAPLVSELAQFSCLE